jgi:hypothetical protein
MTAQKDKGVISIRPKENSSIKEELIKLAQGKKWSLNLYVLEVLEDHLRKSKIKK